jgi:hypothetical protein
VPAKSSRGNRLLESALSALAAALDDARVPWMIIGGIAVIAHGVRRFTTDIDATVRGDAVKFDAFLRVLARHDIKPRIDDAAAFARKNLVLLLRHEPTGVDLDVSLAWSAFEHDAIDTAVKTVFGRERVPTATVETLIVMKAIAGRARDLEDIEALLTLYPKLDVKILHDRVAQLAAFAEEPAIVEAFDAVVKRLKKSPRGRRPKGRG